MVDQQRRLKLPMMSNLFQEVAGNHANFRKLGFFEMRDNNRFWVLNRMRLEVKEYPLWLDEIEVHTWVSMMHGPFSNRHFAIFKNGKEIASSFTFWVAIDSRNHKPVRVDGSEVVVLKDKIANCGIAEKIPFFAEGERIGQYRAKKSDIDMLGHVNNVKYVEWLIDQLDTFEIINHLEINYLKEAHLEEDLLFYKKENVISLVRKTDQQAICIFRINEGSE